MRSAPPTLTQFILEQERHHPEATGDFTGLLNAVALAGKIIGREVNKAGLAGILGLTGRTNVQGEEVQKLDEFAHAAMVGALGQSGLICIMGSEEEEAPIAVPEGVRCGPYVALFDPLDGSSNIDVGAPIGTIFSLHRRRSAAGPGGVEDLLQPGTAQVAAGYVIYGSSTMFVYTTGQGVHGFTLDPSLGEFLLSHEGIRLPDTGRTYSINEGRTATWAPDVRRWVEWLKIPDGGTGRPYGARYIGSLVADVHRGLLRGGIFAYPSDARDPARPRAKLRLLYEAAPLAMLVEQAGGAATDGAGRILDRRPAALHERTALFIGNRDEVERAGRFLAGGAE